MAYRISQENDSYGQQSTLHVYDYFSFHNRGDLYIINRLITQNMRVPFDARTNIGRWTSLITQHLIVKQLAKTIFEKWNCLFTQVSSLAGWRSLVIHQFTCSNYYSLLKIQVSFDTKVDFFCEDSRLLSTRIIGTKKKLHSFSFL